MTEKQEKNANAPKTPKRKISKTKMRFRLMIAAIVLFISFSSLVAVTFAWYIYQTGARTSDIRMAVGAGSSLQISNKYDGEYGSSTVMDKFTGLLEPVSTDSILNIGKGNDGFQKATGFTGGAAGQPMLVANLFGTTDTTEYYKTTLFIRVAGDQQDIYLSDIGYEDDDPENPLSTAIRIGFVTHKAGENQDEDKEYIFAINMNANPKAEYNTITGQEGYVLDHTKKDGTTIPMTNLLTPDNFCKYDNETGVTSITENSTALFRVKGAENGDHGTPVQVDVYVWLEGCDQDCNNNLCGKMLKRISLSFAGMPVEE